VAIDAEDFLDDDDGGGRGFGRPGKIGAEGVAIGGKQLAMRAHWELEILL
jgi:hypothetical protein